MARRSTISKNSQRRSRGLPTATGLRCGLVITTDTLAQASPSDVALLAVPEERGGVLGRIELLLGSTGRGVCAEAYMPDGELARQLVDARSELAKRLPEDLMPRGWWPLLDAKLIGATTPRISWERWRPIAEVRANEQVRAIYLGEGRLYHAEAS